MAGVWQDESSGELSQDEGGKAGRIADGECSKDCPSQGGVLQGAAEIIRKEAGRDAGIGSGKQEKEVGS